MTMTDTPPTTGDRPKVVHQLRRARQLADTVTERWPTMAPSKAEQLSASFWALMAEHAGITPPSPDTTALAVELLHQRALEEDYAAGAVVWGSRLGDPVFVGQNLPGSVGAQCRERYDALRTEGRSPADALAVVDDEHAAGVFVDHRGRSGADEAAEPGDGAWLLAAAARAGHEFVCACGRREKHLPTGGCFTVLRPKEPEVHQACGHAHRLNDECPVPPDSAQIGRAHV